VKFSPLPIEGAWLIEPERHHDERGYFARWYCADEYRAHGLDPAVAQSSVSYNAARGTLRGLHFQREPHGEAKTIRCLAGAAFDVMVDLRPGSATYRRWHAVELSADSGRAVYLPPGLAHGFLTLADATTLHYDISVPYVPAASAGLRWDDPTLAIAWPGAPAVISARDAALPLLEAA
jgi:dTDP-4-dehydrorhamnose 3,5-epimerase